MAKLTVESFLKNVENHTANILLDNGVYRHIHCSNNGSSNRHFNIVTYPGYLVISGDMGGFTFRRLNDMFNFFGGYEGKPTHPGINADYWHEKCESVSRFGGVKRFDSEALMDSIKCRADDVCADLEDDWNEYCDKNWANDECDELDSNAEYQTYKAFQESVKAEIIEYFENCDMDEYRYISEIEEFESDIVEGLEFSGDEWEWLTTESYTMQYLWCCHAIVWAIEQYNQQKAKADSCKHLLRTATFEGGFKEICDGCGKELAFEDEAY